MFRKEKKSFGVILYFAIYAHLVERLNLEGGSDYGYMKFNIQSIIHFFRCDKYLKDLEQSLRAFLLKINTCDGVLSKTRKGILHLCQLYINTHTHIYI